MTRAGLARLIAIHAWALGALTAYGAGAGDVDPYPPTGVGTTEDLIVRDRNVGRVDQPNGMPYAGVHGTGIPHNRGHPSVEGVSLDQRVLGALHHSNICIQSIEVVVAHNHIMALFQIVVGCAVNVDPATTWIERPSLIAEARESP